MRHNDAQGLPYDHQPDPTADLLRLPQGSRCCIRPRAGNERGGGRSYTPMMPHTPKAGPGRPRSEAVDAAILDATMALLLSVGSSSLTIEQVAAEAGVGKAAIYRRYADKDELVLAALESRLPARPPIPDTGDSRQDLIEIVTFMHGFVTKQMALFATMLIERTRQPEWIDSFRERFIVPRRAVMVDIIRRGQASGQIRTGFSPTIIVETVMGALLDSHLLHTDEDQRTPEDIVDSLWSLIAAD